MESENVKNKGKIQPPPTTSYLKGKKVMINDVAFYYDKEDTEENYDKIITLEDVILLDNRKPNVLLAISPPLYSSFKPAHSAQNIKTYVEKGDTVIYKDVRYSPDKENLPLVVTSLCIKSLGTMSVIVAELSNGDFSLTNHIKKV